MILATHGIVGGAIGYLLPQNPILSFSLGILSHFVIDAIPHWHYPLLSGKIDKENPLNNDLLINKWFILDLFNIGLDFIFGIVISVFIFHPEVSFDTAIISILSGAIGGVFPDPLQFIYWKLPNKLMLPLQKFHIWIHSETDIDNKHLIGIMTQIAFAAAVIWTTKQI